MSSKIRKTMEIIEEIQFFLGAGILVLGGGGGVEERKSGEAVAISTTAQSLRRNSRKTGYLLDKPKLGPSTTRFLANFTKFQEISALTMPRFESRNVKYCNKLRSPRRDRD